MNGTFTFGKKNNDIYPFKKKINGYNIIQKAPITMNNKTQINNISRINNTKIKHNISMTNSKPKLKNKTKHFYTNSQHLTCKKMINKINSQHLNDRNINRRNYLFINKTQRTSINHSKEKNNLLSNENIQNNRLDSLSPNKPLLAKDKINIRKNETNGKINKYIIYLIPKESKIKILKTKNKDNKKNI